MLTRTGQPLEVTLSLIGMTMLWLVALPQIIRLWKYQTTFFDVHGHHFSQRYRQARVRAFPIAFISGGAMLLGGWLFYFYPPTTSKSLTLSDVVATLAALLWGIGTFFIAPMIFFFNRPKALVAAHIPSQQGFPVERRDLGGGPRHNEMSVA